MDIIDQVENGVLPVDVAFNNNIDKSLVSRWLKDKMQMIDGASNQHLRFIKQNKKSRKHKEVFKKLHALFLKTRAKGKKVSFSWFYTKANIIQKELDQNASRLPKSAIDTFRKKINIKLRRVQRKKRVHKTALTSQLMKWHCTLREVIKTGSQRPDFHPKWGRFLPEQRVNVDQVLLPFAVDRKTTYEPDIPKADRKGHKVWVANPAPGLEKRQCSLQICISPVNNKFRIAIIFRGKGKRISAGVYAAYHKDVDIVENAWADTKVCVEWAQKTLKAGATNINDFILFCDNLEGQISLQFKKEVRKIKELVWHGVKTGPDLWQPVDGGIGRIITILIKHEQQEWLEIDENIEVWMGNFAEKLDVKKRRILITHWVGEAYTKFNGPEYDNLRYRCFQRTRCLITADGSEDHLITPEGLEGYTVPPSLSMVASDNIVSVEPPEPSSPPDDTFIDDDDVDEIHATSDGELEADVEDDRDYSHSYVGRMIKAIYDNGWFTGNITWYNKKMQKLRVLYEDETDDYLSLDEIDGVEIYLLRA